MLKKYFIILFFFCFDIYSTQTFYLITSLYNETNEKRIQEYIICLEKNLAHPAIKEIQIVYDRSKDDARNVLLSYLKQKPVTITYVQGRPTYAYCFVLANKKYPNSRIILANADIYFNDTLYLLDTYDLTNIFLALTRWNVEKDGKLTFYNRSCSQDAWIYQTPIRKFKKADFKLGTSNCDIQIAYQAKDSGFNVINSSLSIQCCHVHQSGIRHYQPEPYMHLNYLFLIPVELGE